LNQKTLQTLEFPKVLERLAHFTSFSASHELALGLLPVTDVQTVRKRQRFTSEAGRLLDLRPTLALTGVYDVRPTVRATGLGGVPEPQQFLDIASTLQGAASLRRTILKVAEVEDWLTQLRGLAERISELPELEQAVGRCLDEGGEVLDSASPRLKQIREETRVAHQRILARLQSILDSSHYKQAIQESILTMREGRYVVPVKADFKGQLRGIVHDQSASGATLFVEPLAVVELNNQWRQLKLDEEAEIRAILRSLAQQVNAKAYEINEAVEMVASIDLALAKARYSRAIRAIEPQVDGFPRGLRGRDAEARSPKRPYLKFLNARHPLLSGEVVPISVWLGREFQALVITGPNTGGKTVALKTVGLLTLMAQAGLHLPVDEGSAAWVFDKVFADIGDEQSIEQSLSTFSSHMANITNTMEYVDANSLVLLDELGAGTDPTEGSALARSIITFLVERGALTVATTHYAELKGFAYTTPGVENAAVEFDVENLSPTYKLSIGLPGQSNALAIARRLGLRSELIEAAQQWLSPDQVRLESLLVDVQTEREEAKRNRLEVERLREETERLKDELNRELQEVERLKWEAENEAREEVYAELAEVRERVNVLAREISTISVTKEWLADAAKWAEKAEADMRKKRTTRRRHPRFIEATRPLEVGDRVWVESLRQEAEVLATPDGNAEVELQIGNFKARLPAVELRRLSKGESTRKREVSFSSSISPMPALELDLRGWRAEDVEPSLERYLNDAYLAGLPSVRIIHGKGTGVLRKVVREILAAHPLVRAYESGGSADGGEGVTIASLAS
jgi:DNA mismatch repair protein MutS2